VTDIDNMTHSLLQLSEALFNIPVVSKQTHEQAQRSLFVKLVRNTTVIWEARRKQAARTQAK